MAEQPKNPWIEAKRRARKARKQAWNEAHRLKDRAEAWQAVKEAVQAGEMQRQPCQVKTKCCEGHRAPTFFHHTHGYEPEHHLTGVWACRPCHDHLHRIEQARKALREHRKQALERGKEAGVLVIDDDH